MVLLIEEGEMLVRVNIHSEVFTLQTEIANHKLAFLCKRKNIRTFIFIGFYRHTNSVNEIKSN